MRILILASAADQVAADLSERLDRSDILVMTPDDLSRPGWSYRPGEASSVLAVGDELRRSEEIAAVITRLPWISQAELPRIVAGDRAYVAAEMSAFLLAWLSELPCPVANRPSPNCLCGPFWRHERWVMAAAHAGLSVQPARRSGGGLDPPHPSPTLRESASVTVVGERCFGDSEASLMAEALHLARATGVVALTVHFGDSGSGMRFLTANPWPCLEEDEPARALLEHLVPSGPY